MCVCMCVRVCVCACDVACKVLTLQELWYQLAFFSPSWRIHNWNTTIFKQARRLHGECDFLLSDSGIGRRERKEEKGKK